MGKNNRSNFILLIITVFLIDCCTAQTNLNGNLLVRSEVENVQYRPVVLMHGILTNSHTLDLPVQWI